MATGLGEGVLACLPTSMGFHTSACSPWGHFCANGLTTQAGARILLPGMTWGLVWVKLGEKDWWPEPWGIGWPQGRAPGARRAREQEVLGQPQGCSLKAGGRIPEGPSLHAWHTGACPPLAWALWASLPPKTPREAEFTQ